MIWKYSSDHVEWQARTEYSHYAISLLLRDMFGERCKEYEEGCECCRRWRLLDELLANPFEGDAEQ